MGYERNDRRPGGGYCDDRNRDYDRGRYGSSDNRSAPYGRDQGYRGDRSDYGRDPRGYDYQDRGFVDRAGDEVRSWFGDEDAERRRRADERYQAREQGSDDQRNRDGGRFAPYGSGYTGATGYDAGGGNSSGDYGQRYGAGATGNYGSGAGNDRQSQDQGRDPGYHSWRSRQIDQFDRDYDEYRREHQQKFDNEFHSWRQNRQGQRDLLGKVQEHHEVVGSDGQHIGTVDHIRGDRILLTKNDQAAGGHHHSIPSSWITSVEDKVTINKSAEEAKKAWRDEDRGAFFGDNDRNQDRGNTNLNRSFSGTY